MAKHKFTPQTCPQHSFFKRYGKKRKVLDDILVKECSRCGLLEVEGAAKPYGIKLMQDDNRKKLKFRKAVLDTNSRAHETKDIGFWLESVFSAPTENEIAFKYNQDLLSFIIGVNQLQSVPKQYIEELKNCKKAAAIFFFANDEHQRTHNIKHYPFYVTEDMIDKIPEYFSSRFPNYVLVAVRPYEHVYLKKGRTDKFLKKKHLRKNPNINNIHEYPTIPHINL